MKKVIKFLLVIGWMFLIFSFSNQNGEESSSTSAGFIERMITVFCDDSMDEVDKGKIVDKYAFFVRKTAHFMVYFVLGIFVFNLLIEFKLKHLILVTTFICMAYAISDEIHQSLVPERSCEIRDTLIDTGGSLLSSCVCFLICKKNNKNV